MTTLADHLPALARAGLLPAVRAIEALATAAGDVDLCSFALAYPCGTVAAGVLTLAGFPSSDLDPEESGTAAGAELRDSDGNVARAMTVGLASADVIFESLAIRSGYPVVMQSATYTETE